MDFESDPHSAVKGDGPGVVTEWLASPFYNSLECIGTTRLAAAASALLSRPLKTVGGSDKRLARMIDGLCFGSPTPSESPTHNDEAAKEGGQSGRSPLFALTTRISLALP
jgi:hypothetical protein